MKKTFFSLIAACLFTLPLAAEEFSKGSLETIQQYFGSMTSAFDSYDVIIQPDTIAPEWWAGAPSVVRDSDGVFWMACRMRSAELPRGLRGYEIRILRSTDGVHFNKVHAIHSDDVPMKGFERPCLLMDPHTHMFKLYACGPWKNGPWSIIRFDDASDPTRFDPTTARAVIQPIAKTYPRDTIPIEYKDPFILFAQGNYHAYVIGYIRQTERIFHFSSPDGETWKPVGSPHHPIMDLTGWHDFFVRPASVLPVGIGYLFFYEGSHTQWYDPVYNMNTGVGFTFDLHNIIDLTPDMPLVCSSTPNRFFSTWRYSHWIQVEDELWVYAEVATVDETHEIRLFRIQQP
jgi:hypothetical protein